MARNPADPKWQRTCVGCGAQFYQRRARQVYCTRQCSEDHRKDWARPRGGVRAAAGLAPRICGTCDNEYQPTRSDQQACSRTCRDALPEQRRIQHDRDSAAGRQSRQNELRRARYAEDPTKIRAANRRQLLAKYGLTPEQFDEMKAAQGGVCALCGEPPDPDGKRAAADLHADHDHRTNQHRDLLCLNCNVGIGMFRDDPALLRRAAAYIERHRAVT